MHARKTSHTVRQMVKGSQHEQANERSEAEKIKAINELYARDEPESDNIAIMVANQGKVDKKNTKFKVRSNQLGEGHDIYGNSDTEHGNTERGPTVSTTNPNLP